MIRYYLNEIECNPSNRDVVEFVFNFKENRDKETLELNVTSLKFEMEDLTRINNFRATYGNYVGMPFHIIYSDGTRIDYLLDFTDGMVVKNRSIEVNLKRYKGWDMFVKNSSGLSFFDPNIKWVTSDFGSVDYEIVPKDQLSIYITLLTTLLALSLELARSIKQIVEGVTDIIEASVPAGPWPVFGAIISMGIKLAARIAMTIAIIIAIVKLGGQLKELIFPKTRQYKSITFKNLIKKGVEYLGFSLESTLLDSLGGATILAQPTRGKGNLFEKLFQPLTLAYTDGYPSVNDTIVTLQNAIDQFEFLSGGETRIIDGVVKIETRAYFASQANQTLKQNFNLQDELQDEISINSGEQYKRMVTRYRQDPLDLNTYDDMDGNIGEVSNEIINTPKPHLELLSNYTELNMAFARGTRKNELTWLQKAAKEVLQVIDVFTNKSLASQISNKTGNLQITEQYFSTTKLLYCVGSKLHPNQNSFIGAETIQNRHEYKNIVNNQRNILSNMPLAMTESEMFKLLDNNFVFLQSGEQIEIERVAWSEHTHMATVDLAIKTKAINEKSITL